MDKPVEIREERGRFGGDARSINRHSVRVYEWRGRRYTLDKTLDGVPPFYTLFGKPDSGYGVSRVVKVNGKEYWGDRLAWRMAEEMAFDAIMKEA